MKYTKPKFKMGDRVRDLKKDTSHSLQIKF